jgi:hypothetical protein
LAQRSSTCMCVCRAKSRVRIGGGGGKSAEKAPEKSARVEVFPCARGGGRSNRLGPSTGVCGLGLGLASEDSVFLDGISEQLSWDRNTRESHYLPTRLPPCDLGYLVWQPDRTNWCHGLPAGHALRQGIRHRALTDGTAESAAESAGGHLPYAPTVPGSHRTGPGDPGGALYGRTAPMDGRTESPARERG